MKESSPYRVQPDKVKKGVRLSAVASNPIDLVSRSTGEVVGATPYVGRRTVRDISDFVKVYSPMELLELSERELKVFCWALSGLDFDGKFSFDGAKCKEELGFKCERSAYYGLKGLVEKDFIRKDRKGIYWINPNIAFRGSRDELMEL